MTAFNPGLKKSSLQRYFAISIGIQGIKKRLKLLLSGHKFKTELICSIHSLKILKMMQGKLPRTLVDKSTRKSFGRVDI
jgi:hypothetical protein